jgi:hypothetical protein
MSIKGFPSSQKLPLGTGITNEFVTIQPTDEFRYALDIPRFAFRVNPAPLTAAANTGTIDGVTWVYDTATDAKKGDFVRFDSGANEFLEVPIVKVEANRFLLGAKVNNVVPGDTFYIMRYATQLVGDDGSQIVTITPSPIVFVKNGVDTEVEEDTSTPGNSIPLPVKILNGSGVQPDFATETTLTSLNGKDFATETTLSSLNGKDFATETTLTSLNSKDFASETTLSSLNGKDFATETTLSSLNSKDFSTFAEQQTQSGLLQDISDQQLSVESTGNTSTAPLGIGGVFTGTAVEITNFSAINVAVKSDVASATDGLSMQFSPDGTNWDHTHNYTVGVNGVSFAQACELKYFRIVYTNGAVAQSSFRLTTILKRNNVSPSRYTVEQPMFGGQMADVVKANIWGLTTGGGGGYVAVKVNPSGALTTETTISGTVPVSGPLTDTELRASAVPVSGPLTDAQLRATAVPISGTVSTGLSQPLTDAQLRASDVPVSGPLTDVQLRATAVPISGTVTANTGLSQPLTDTQLRATPVPISGTVSTGLTQPLTDAQLRATAVPVSGPLTDAQLRASAVPVSGPLTDAQLRASAVPVSGTFYQATQPVSGPLTDAELRASAVPVSGTFYQATQPVSVATLPAVAGRAKVQQLFNDYSATNVTTAAYVQLIASSTSAVNKIEIFDSSGEALILAVGGAGSEVDQLYIFPGGNGAVDLAIPASSRISVKAKTATASSGFLAINLYS